MQDWKEFAKKNNLVVKETGPCQLCGALVSGGVSECLGLATSIAHKLPHEQGVQYMTIFLCVDAHALQHPEIHGRWSNHYHLARTHLILNKKITWSYDFSRQLSSIVNAYKPTHQDEILVPNGRGDVTVKDVAETKTAEEFIKVVNAWAESVFQTYSKDQSIAETLSKEFLKSIN